MRKTLEVTALVTSLNEYIQHAPTPEERRAFAHVAEHVLFESDTYRGFRYLPSELNEDGTLKDGYDDTRRNYYLPRYKQ